MAQDFPVARPFYAAFHVHAHDTVGTNSPVYNAAHARDVWGLDVFGYTANDFQITDRNWTEGVEAVRGLDVPGHFVVYPVQEWCGSSAAGGNHNAAFLGESPPAFPHNARGEHDRTFQWNEDMSKRAGSLARWSGWRGRTGTAPPPGNPLARRGFPAAGAWPRAFSPRSVR